MTIKKPAEFRPATNYDTNPYYDENFDHTVTDPFKKIDGRLDALEETVDTAETGLSDRVEALETTVDTASTGLSDRVEALESAKPYDLLIKLNRANLVDASSASVEDGSYANVAAKVAADKPFVIMAYGSNTENNGNKYQAQFGVFGAQWDSYVQEGEDPIIRLSISDKSIVANKVYVATSSGGSNTSQILAASGAIKQLIVTSDNSVTFG